MSDVRSEFRWALTCWGVLAGIIVCAVGYWPLVFALRRAWDVPGFPPGGGLYWLAWGLPLITVATIGTATFTIWRGARPAVAGFAVACLLTGLAMCAFGYSVDSMPYYM